MDSGRGHESIENEGVGFEPRRNDEKNPSS